MIAEFDEMLWDTWAGAQMRPLTTREVVQHLEPFGLSKDVICNRQISMLSSGQKSKLVFGAAFWTRPHVLCLDEPTNYLDVDTVDMLQRAIRNFRGGCAVVSHSQTFVEQACDEVWEIRDGKVTVNSTVRGTGGSGCSDSMDMAAMATAVTVTLGGYPKAKGKIKAKSGKK